MSWTDQTLPSGPPVEEHQVAGSGSKLGRRKVALIASLIVVILLAAGTAVFFAWRSSDSSSSENKRFESLIAAINSGENIFQVEYLPAIESANRSLSRAPIGEYSVSEWERWDDAGGIDLYLDDIQSAGISAREELRGVTAELVSLRFSKDSKLDQARDAAIEHYDAWREALPDYYKVAEDYFYGGAFEEDWPNLSTFSDVMEEDTPAQARINPTWKTLCASLSDAQPSSGKFESQIRDICDN